MKRFRLDEESRRALAEEVNKRAPLPRVRTTRFLHTEAIRNAAIQYLNKGWRSVRIPAGAKNPTAPQWQKQRIGADIVSDYFTDDDNIGVQLGRRSAGLSDVDLDCLESLKLADSFLPATAATFGRESKPASHRLYITNLFETDTKGVRQYAEPPELGGKMLVELRTGGNDKGACTLFPPSRHPSGEMVRWDSEGDPARVDGGVLRNAVAVLAAATLLARHYPAMGTRHEAALVLGGLVARAGWDADAIFKFVKIIAEAAHDEESAERAKSASGAVRLLANGAECPGLRRMGEAWGQPVADTLAKWLGIAIPSDRQVDGRVILPAGAPVDAADKFVEQGHMHGRIPLLRHYRGAFYQWTGTHYRLLPDEFLERDVYAFLKGAFMQDKKGNVMPYNPTKQKVLEVVHALRRSALLVPQDWQGPFWLHVPGDEAVYKSAAGLIACTNGILDLQTRELVPHDPLFFTPHCLPFAYDPAAPKPERWLHFLEEVWPADAEGNWDKEAENTLQEIFGYVLTDDTEQQKIFLIVGPKRGGKGTIVSVIVQLLGRDNTVFQTFDSLTGEFGRWPLIDKKLGVFADARLGSGGNIHRLVETLLSISGGDPQTINRKYGDFWTGLLGVRFMITTNVLPALKDSSGTIASRFVMLRLTESFYGREDSKLKSKLKPELPGIFNWALAGLDRLNNRGSFRQPASSRQAIKLLEDLAAPVGAFVRDWCTTKTNARVNVKELYRAYRDWASETGHKAEQAHMFGKGLRDVTPTLSTVGRGVNRSYVGITLTEDGRAAWDELQSEKGGRRS